MSKLNELKSMSPKLRTAMARRDSIRKHVNKHKSNVAHCDAQIERLNTRLAEMTDTTIARVSKFETDKELELDYAAKAGALLKGAQAEVDVMLAELETIKAKQQPKAPVKAAVQQVITDNKQGLKERDAQQSGYETAAEQEAAELKDAAAIAAITESEAEAEDTSVEDEIKAMQAKIAELEANKAKPAPAKEKPVVPEVNPPKDDADDAPPTRGVMSKSQRRRARRAARLAS